MPDRILKRHDTAIVPRIIFEDEDRVPIDLTDATIYYTLRDRLTKRVKILRGVGAIQDQSLYPGYAYYQVTTGDVDTAGEYEEQWEAVYLNGKKESRPYGMTQRVRIEADYDNT